MGINETLIDGREFQEILSYHRLFTLNSFTSPAKHNQPSVANHPLAAIHAVIDPLDELLNKKLNQIKSSQLSDKDAEEVIAAITVAQNKLQSLPISFKLEGLQERLTKLKSSIEKLVPQEIQSMEILKEKSKPSLHLTFFDKQKNTSDVDQGPHHHRPKV